MSILENPYLLLLALSRAPKEGWSVASAVADVAKGLRQDSAIPFSTAYTAIRTLQINGWVHVVRKDASGPGRPKILYGLTDNGRLKVKDVLDLLRRTSEYANAAPTTRDRP